MQEQDLHFMRIALEEADKSARRGEVPVGAVLVDGKGNVVARNGNRCIELCDPTGHAEIMVMQDAGKRIGNYRLTGTTLYVTLEPCAMCAGAMVHARISRLVYGADDPKAGAVKSIYTLCSDRRLNHVLHVDGGVLAGESSVLLRLFFRDRRAS